MTPSPQQQWDERILNELFSLQAKTLLMERNKSASIVAAEALQAINKAVEEIVIGSNEPRLAIRQRAYQTQSIAVNSRNQLRNQQRAIIGGKS